MPEPEASAGHLPRPRRRVLLAAGGLVLLVTVALGLAVIIGRLLSPSTPESALPPPRYVEEALAAGLDHRYDGEYEHFVGGGVAVFDCDDDGLPDVYLAGGSRPAALYRNRSPIGGALRFEPLPGAATDLEAVTGAYPLDIDSDGVTDLAVLRRGENVLLRGTGACRFERADEAWGFDGGDAWTTAFSATWEAGSPWPTMAFGNYHDEAFTDVADLCYDDVLVRPAASGHGFGAPATLSPSWCALSMLFSDWDRSGRRDLRVSNDRHYYSELTDGQEQLWRVEPGQPPRLYTEADGWRGMRLWGMGIASQDLTGDGRPEVYLTSQGDNKLQVLDDGATSPTYHDIALKSGAIAHRPYTGGDGRPSTAWHAQFDDVNNDGWMDLFVAKGNVEAQPDLAEKDPSNLLIGQPDLTFVEGAEAAGIVDFARGRGAAVVDLNLDGLLDIIEVKRRENVRLRRNVGAGTTDAPAPMGHWSAIRLHQSGPNPDAIGAWISVRVGDRVIERELTVGGGHAGGQLGPTHFGLGSADRAEVRVQWPDGEIGPWMPLPADRIVILERGADAVTPLAPGAE